MVLILDLEASIIISNYFKVTELVDLKINFLERLEVKRKRMTDLHGVYLMEPSRGNVKFLQQDYSSDKPQYRKAHVLFTTFVPKSLLGQIAADKRLMKKIAKNSVREIYFSTKTI